MHDIKESCAGLKYDVACQLLALSVASATPMKHSIDNYTGPCTIRYDPRMCASEVPPLPTNCLAPAGRVSSLGIPRNALEQVPLVSELTEQHLPSRNFAFQRQLLVLEGNGLHVLQKLRPVDYLYDAIQVNLNNSERLQRVLSSLSSGYGADQYCAMMVGIACGLPSDAGGNPHLDVTCTVGVNVHYDSDIRSAAIQYLRLPPSSSPKARPNQIPDPVGVDASTLGDTDVQTSCVYNGFELFLSRLLRPVWLKEVVDEDPVYKKNYPAQWLSLDLIASLLVPLQELKKVLLLPFMYESIIRSNHRFTSYSHNTTDQQNMTGNMAPSSQTGGASQHYTGNRGTYNLSSGGDAYSGASSSSRGSANPGNAFLSRTGNLTMDELRQRLARDYENECICKLYRLLARTIQALQLLSLLLTADLEWRLSLSWRDFRGLSLRKIVTSMRAHDKIKTGLRKLILSSSRSSKHKLADARSMTINLTNRLKNDCYMFYSEGDEKWHEAEENLASLETMISNSLSSVSPEVRRQAKAAITMLVDAAGHWYDPDLVVPYGSEKTELELKCEQLMRLGEIGRVGVPELCMSAVRNFSAWSPSYQYLKGSSIGSGTGSDAGLAGMGRASSSASHTTEGVDDRGLYHGGNVLTPAEMDKARVSVYNTLLSAILSLDSEMSGVIGSGSASNLPRGERLSAGEVEGKMLEMVVASIHLCNNDSVFHQLLCDALFKNHKEVLVRINEPFVEHYLLESDEELLYRWHGHHGFHDRATERMYKRAVAVNTPGASSPITIHQRVEYMRFALRSANAVGSGNKYNYLSLLSLGEAWVRVYDSFTRLLTGMQELRDAASAEMTDQYRPVISSIEEITERCLYNFIVDEGLESTSSSNGHYRAQHTEAEWLLRKCEEFQLWEDCMILATASPSLTMSPQKVDIFWRSIVYR